VKNQYFGDINDYRKYGLLRQLSGAGQISTAVCWMLTPDDGRTDGSLVTYLHQPATWRRFDPELFDCLKDLVLGQNRRDVRAAESAGILPTCRFFDEVLADDRAGRAAYFESFFELAQGCELIFFDPDNGIEVKSKPYGRKGSSKYIYWRELTASFSRGHSLLIYQHFPRVPRRPFIDAKARELVEKTGADEVYSFRTPRVVFFLVPQERHREDFREGSQKVADVWATQIELSPHQGRASRIWARLGRAGAWLKARYSGCSCWRVMAARS
jgi:hypothetical protein